MTPKVSQGVTTVITGNCGISLAHSPAPNGAPTPPLDLLDTEGRLVPVSELSRVPRGRSKRSPRRSTPRASSATRRSASRPWTGSTARRRPPRSRRCARWRASRSPRARSASPPGTAYPPAAARPPRRSSKCAGRSTEFGGLYVTHMRNEDDRITDSMEETFAIGREPRRAGRHLAPQVRRHAQSRPLAGDAGADRARRMREQPVGARLLSLHRVVDGAALRPARAVLAHHHHVVEAAPGVLGRRSRRGRAAARHDQGRSGGERSSRRARSISCSTRRTCSGSWRSTTR